MRFGGVEAFEAVVDRFLAEQPITVRFPRQIPAAFSAWLMAQASLSLSLPDPAFADLCHFEALELEITLAVRSGHVVAALRPGESVVIDDSARLGIHRHAIQHVTISTAWPPPSPSVALCWQRDEVFVVAPLSPAPGKVQLHTAAGHDVETAVAVVVAEANVDGGLLRSLQRAVGLDAFDAAGCAHGSEASGGKLDGGLPRHPPAANDAATDTADRAVELRLGGGHLCALAFDVGADGVGLIFLQGAEVGEVDGRPLHRDDVARAPLTAREADGGDIGFVFGAAHEDAGDEGTRHRHPEPAGQTHAGSAKAHGAQKSTSDANRSRHLPCRPRIS